MTWLITNSGVFLIFLGPRPVNGRQMRPGKRGQQGWLAGGAPGRRRHQSQAPSSRCASALPTLKQGRTKHDYKCTILSPRYLTAARMVCVTFKCDNFPEFVGKGSDFLSPELFGGIAQLFG